MSRDTDEGVSHACKFFLGVRPFWTHHRNAGDVHDGTGTAGERVRRPLAVETSEDVPEAQHGEDHHDRASMTQMVERKHQKSNKVRIITTTRVQRFPDSLRHKSMCLEFQQSDKRNPSSR